MGIAKELVADTVMTVDLHSHVGLISTPVTAGALEADSPNGPILPWLRAVDALNTHDAAYAYALAGGVTTVQVLPDSGRNALGRSPHHFTAIESSFRSRWTSFHGQAAQDVSADAHVHADRAPLPAERQQV